MFHRIKKFFLFGAILTAVSALGMTPEDFIDTFVYGSDYSKKCEFRYRFINSLSDEDFEKFAKAVNAVEPGWLNKSKYEEAGKFLEEARKMRRGIRTSAQNCDPDQLYHMIRQCAQQEKSAIKDNYRSYKKRTYILFFVQKTGVDSGALAYGDKKLERQYQEIAPLMNPEARKMIDELTQKHRQQLQKLEDARKEIIRQLELIARQYDERSGLAEFLERKDFKNAQKEIQQLCTEFYQKKDEASAKKVMEKLPAALALYQEALKKEAARYQAIEKGREEFQQQQLKSVLDSYDARIAKSKTANLTQLWKQHRESIAMHRYFQQELPPPVKTEESAKQIQTAEKALKDAKAVMTPYVQGKYKAKPVKLFRGIYSGMNTDYVKLMFETQKDLDREYVPTINPGEVVFEVAVTCKLDDYDALIAKYTEEIGKPRFSDEIANWKAQHKALVDDGLFRFIPPSDNSRFTRRIFFDEQKFVLVLRCADQRCVILLIMDVPLADEIQVLKKQEQQKLKEKQQQEKRQEIQKRKKELDF